MITGRNVILASIAVFVLAMILNVITLMQPLDNDGKGSDSYGVYPSGYRALVEIMQEVDVPVARTHAPFDREITHRATYVLAGPDVALLESEEDVLRQLETWVHDGGQLVVSFVEGWPSSKFMRIFSLEEVRFVDLDKGELLYDIDYSESEEQIPIGLRKFLEDAKRHEAEGGDRSLGDDFDEIITFSPPKCVKFPVAECTGRFRPMCASVEQLAVREDDPVALDVGDSSPDSVLTIDGPIEPRTLMAEYVRGKGSVVLVSDVSLFHNLSLREGDNSLLLLNLLGERREIVLFDEFFHGLSIRGNPIWIFAQPGYRIIVLMLLGIVALFIWHELPAFGVIHPPEKTARRTLEHYLDAVSRMLLRTRSQLEQLLTDSKSAFLWRMARKLHLAGERNQLAAIRNRLRRTDAEMLERFDGIIAEFDRYHHQGCSPKELLALLQRSHRCLS